MICPHQGCLFVHIPKTAGQSVEHVFLSLNGLTWEQREALLLRPNADPQLGPPRLAHLTAAEYLRYGYVSPEVFQQFFKFAFVRNPWARMVSIYRHLSYGVTFRDYLLGEFQRRVWKDMYWFVRPQYEFVYDEDGRLLVDFVGRFERLQEDFLQVCQRMGLAPMRLPHVNRAQEHAAKARWGWHPRQMVRYLRKRRFRKPAPQYPHWRDYYDADTRALVASLYQMDIQAFGYTFDAPTDEPRPAAPIK